MKNEKVKRKNLKFNNYCVKCKYKNAIDHTIRLKTSKIK